MALLQCILLVVRGVAYSTRNEWVFCAHLSDSFWRVCWVSFLSFSGVFPFSGNCSFFIYHESFWNLWLFSCSKCFVEFRLGCFHLTVNIWRVTSNCISLNCEGMEGIAPHTWRRALFWMEFEVGIDPQKNVPKRGILLCVSGVQGYRWKGGNEWWIVKINLKKLVLIQN